MEGNQAPGPPSPETLRAPGPSQACTHGQTHEDNRGTHLQAHTPPDTHTQALRSHADPQADQPSPRMGAHHPLSSRLPTLAPCGLVLSPEATCCTLFEELRLEAPQATRAFGGGISFGPRAMAVWEEGRGLHWGDPARHLPWPPTSSDLPSTPSMPFWGLEASMPLPPSLPPAEGNSGATLRSEGGPGGRPLPKVSPTPRPGLLHEGWASPHFAIIIKLLADQSLVGTAGVLEEAEEKADPISAHGQPTQGFSVAPASASPPLSSTCQLKGADPGARKTRAGLPSTPSPAV